MCVLHGARPHSPEASKLPVDSGTARRVWELRYDQVVALGLTARAVHPEL
jgi:hypothetical protein